MRRQMYTELCPRCHAHVEIQTLQDQDVITPETARPADELYCTECGCEGVIFTYLGVQQSTWAPPCTRCMMQSRYIALTEHIKMVDGLTSDDLAVIIDLGVC